MRWMLMLVMTGPMVARPDEISSALKDSGRVYANTAWNTNISAAMWQARRYNKFLLLDFTGSGWCPACVQFERDVLSTPEFSRYAGNHLVLMRVDFPTNAPSLDTLQKVNDSLKSQYNVRGIPTLILLDPTGKECGRQKGYLPGGPGAFISELEKFSKR